MKKLEGFQKKYLRGLAHSMNPVVFIGQKGLTDALVKAVNSALAAHELIKVKFVDLKDKDEKDKIIFELENRSKCEKVGMIGHMAILYKKIKDPEKRRIFLPKRTA